MLGGGSWLGATLLTSCRQEEEAEPEEGVQPAPAAAAEYGPFQMGFQSYSLREFQELGTFVTQAERLGVEYVEVYSGHLSTTASDEEIENFKSRLAQAGMQINAFGVENFTADHEQNRRLFEFGKKLGVRNLSANPTKDAFDSLDELVREYDIRIAIHNHGPEDERWRRPEWILEAVKDRDPRIGACVDTGHYIRAGVNPVEAIQMLGSRVLGVHLKDFNQDMQEVLVGQGQLDLNATLSSLREVGLEGPLSLEYEDHADDPVPHMLQELESVRQVIAGW